MSTRIVWAVVIGFFIGVFVRSLIEIPLSVMIAMLGIAALAVLATFFSQRFAREVLFGALTLVALTGGVARMDAAIMPIDVRLASQVGREISTRGVIVREPDVRERSVRLTIQTDSAKLLAIAPAHTDVEYGDVIAVTGELQAPKAFESGEGRVFNYPMFLAKDGIQYTVAFAEVEVVGHEGLNVLQSAAISFKHAYIAGLQAVLPEPYAGLAGGITVGDKRSVGSELSEIFQQVSLIHILVLSGYNITIVLNALSGALQWIPRALRLAVSGIVIVFIIMMAGGASSATRAGAMAFIGVYARQSGRLFFALRILAVVGSAMVVWNPYMLVFDPGFQLSMLATLGLVLFTPSIATRLPWITERFALREIAASTLATQITVLPLLLYQNGLLSLVALPANLATLIVVPAAMAASIGAAFAGMILGSWGTLLALPAYALLAYIIGVAELAASVSFASISIGAFSAWWLLPIYTALFAYAYIKKTAGSSPAVDASTTT